MTYKKPKLKTPPPPEYAVLDLDSVLFKAAQAGQQIKYSAKDPDGNIVASFNSAAEYDNWLEEIDVFGDMIYGFDGNPEDLTREVSYEELDVKRCYKAFDKMVKEWVEKSGCEHWVGYVSKNSGMKNFRYDIASIRPYKGNRDNLQKPIHLEAVRKYAARQKNIKIARGNVEVDDVTCAIAQKKGWKGCVVSVDKDARGVQNTHILLPDEMEKPEFSSKKIIGRLYKDDKGKIVGCGTLFWLYQCIGGDNVDNIQGCKGIGSTGSYNLLKEFDGVSSEHLQEAVNVVCEAFKKSYGCSHQYTCAITEKDVQAHWQDIAVEMSRLVYMKKSQKDDCFWIDHIRNYREEEV